MKAKVAENLLEIGAVFLKPNDPFTWSSGIKSPIYCDNRLTLSYPKVRRLIAEGLAKTVKESYPDAEVIAGTATAGIPHAAWVSELLNLPMCYVRSKPKGHGKQSQIEGVVQPGQKVVVIEDLISTGGSSITAADALRNEGAEVLGVAAIFTYELPVAEERFAEAKLTVNCISNYSALIDVANEKNIIADEDMEKLQAWRKDPNSEAWMEN